MTLQTLTEWLRCPHCAEALEPQPPLVARCINGHSFDANKRGYINLLPAGNRMIGDSPEMLDARSAFLEAGHFSAIRDALVRAALAAGEDAGVPPRILDAGCGTGYYLAGLLNACGAVARALALDISVPAVMRSVRAAGQQGDGLVADTWQPIPVRDSTASMILTVFAPRNLPEFARILQPSGALLVVVPTASHIQEVRRGGRAIDIPSEKAERLIDEAAPLFLLAGREQVEYSAHLSPGEIDELVSMGPSAHHPSEALSEARETLQAVTVSVDVLRFTRN